LVAGVQATHDSGGDGADTHLAGASQTAEHHGNVHDHSPRAAILKGIRPLPAWMFWLPLIIAYVTPFYMMRCWWLTFMGKPRDHHVHDHAHESPMMFIPLAVLAVGTFFSSYYLFRPVLADAAPTATDAALVVGLDGVADAAAEHRRDAGATNAPAGEPVNLHAAHKFLNLGVGFSWLAGFAVAWLIYRNGLATAAALAGLPLLRPMHAALERKLFFDDVYDNVLVRGTVLIAQACRHVFDAFIDFLVNLSAWVTERFARFTGRQMDMSLERGDVGLVDAIVNGVAAGAMHIGDGVRSSQSGRIRGYLLVAAGSAALVLLAVLYGPQMVNSVMSWVSTTPATAMK
jgi:NADH-quinone oxidoreductase subunit L